MQTINNRQWLADIALQTSGSIEALFDLALANGLGITDTIEPGTRLQPAPVIDARVHTWYTNNRVQPATALLPTEVLQEGVGSWTVQFNFVVS